MSEFEGLKGLLSALADDCAATDGWEEAAPTCHKARAAIETLEARYAELMELAEGMAGTFDPANCPFPKRFGECPVCRTFEAFRSFQEKQ
jgi:hypothetical protein